AKKKASDKPCYVKPEARKTRHETIVNKGGISALTKLSRSADGAIRMSCARAFNSLASESRLRREILKEGAAGAVVALAQSTSHRGLKRQCMTTLCRLAAMEGAEVELMAQGAVSCLLHVEKSTPSLLKITLQTLINLSTTESNYSLRLLIMTAICNLSCFKNNIHGFVEDGALKVTLASSIADEERALCSLCAHALSNFSSDHAARSKMSDKRTIGTLLSLAKSHDPESRGEVALAIARLANDVACREKILEYGAVPVLVEMCTATVVSECVAQSCSMAFRVFAMYRDLANIVVDSGGMKGMIALTERGDLQTKENCAVCFCHLIKQGVRIQQVLKGGIVEALVTLCNPGNTATTQEICAVALCLLLRNNPTFEHVEAKYVVRSLNRLCLTGNLAIRKRCVAAMWSLTCQILKPYSNPIGTADIVPTLLELLQGEDETELKADCAAALYNLAQVESHCELMISLGALLPILSLAEGGSVDTKIQCISILQRMLLGHVLPHDVKTPSFVKTLLTVSKLEHRSTQQRITIAIYRLSCEREGRLLLLQEGAPVQLLRLISKPNEAMRKGCAATLINLTYEEGAEAKVAEAAPDTTSVLIITAMVACDSDDTKNLCTQAIGNLLHNSAYHDQMVKDGTIWGLAAMSANKDSTEIVRLCSKALCQMSKKYWFEIAGSRSIQSVLSLVTSEDLQTCLAACKTVLNVLLMVKEHGHELEKAKGGHKETTIDRANKRVTSVFSDMVPVMKQIINHESEEVRVVALQCMCLGSTDVGGREEIERHAIIKLINLENIHHDEESCFAYITLLYNLVLDYSTQAA
ncbi:unnamed protein product, partial [Chrysoparadoxa australica]